MSVDVTSRTLGIDRRAAAKLLSRRYFETYRFSKDLDCTLGNEDQIDEAFLRGVREEVIAVADKSGLTVPADQLGFDIYDNPRGRPNGQGKVAYRGPVSPTSGGWRKIKLDLTTDERVVLPSVRREVFHPYSDRRRAASGPIATPMRKPSEKSCAGSVNARAPATFMSAISVQVARYIRSWTSRNCNNGGFTARVIAYPQDHSASAMLVLSFVWLASAATNPPSSSSPPSIFQAQSSARISMIIRDELLYQTADETPRRIIVRMPTPPSTGTLLARMRHRAIRLAHS